MSLVHFKQLWANYVAQEDLPKILSLYDKNFIFRGTFAKNTTSNRTQLEKYFKGFSKDVSKVVFLKNSSLIKNKDTYIDNGKYNFHTSEGGVIKAEYQFVLKKKEKDFKIISHFSFLIK